MIDLKRTKNRLFGYAKDPLYENSLYITLARILNVFCGFLFWNIAARYYSIESVGVATALISSLNLVILFSRFGFDISIIRFLPINDKNKVFNTCLTITTTFSFIVGIIYVAGIKFFSPGLSFIQIPKFAIIFIIFVVISSITLIMGNAFIAMRKAKYYFLQNVFMASRVLLLIPLVFLGSFGIFGSAGIAYFVAAFFLYLVLKKFLVFNLKIDKNFIRKSFKFSSMNYISNIFFAIPTLILPIIILNLLGGAEAAKYYIAFAIGNLVLIVPTALTTSLFVEGSHGESLRKNVIKAGLGIYSFLIPAVIFIYFFGDFLLGLFGKDYVEALELLRLITLSSLFVAIYSLFIPIQNVRMRVESIVKLNFIRLLLLLGSSYLFILKFGIVGVGYAWMMTYGILSLGIVGLAKKEEWF